MQSPKGWAADSLTKYLDRARDNAFASFVRSDEYRDLAELDVRWLSLAETIGNAGTVLEGMFLIRAHAAWRSATYSAMTGQIPEVFVLLRSALECSLYAHHVYAQSAAEEIWLRRTDSETTKEASRSEFSVGNVKRSLVKADRTLAKITTHLYDVSIEFGGHPNEQALLAVTDKVTQGGETMSAFRC